MIRVVWSWQPKKPDFATVNILIASRQIRIGEVITSEMVTSQPWPEHLLVESFVTSGEASYPVVGQVARGTFQSGEPILKTKLANRNDPGFLAAALSPNMRMVTIASDGIAGLAGLVIPGDRVDVLITYPIPAEDREPDSDDTEQVTETILNNVRVLAVNQQVTGTKDKKDQRLPSSISLEVTLEDAQRLRLGQDAGYLSLALRSIDAVEEEEIPSLTRAKNISQSGVYDEGDGRNGVVVVIRGTEMTEINVAVSQEDDEYEEK